MRDGGIHLFTQKRPQIYGVIGIWIFKVLPLKASCILKGSQMSQFVYRINCTLLIN